MCSRLFLPLLLATATASAGQTPSPNPPRSAPDWPKPAIEVFVSPQGADTNPGTREAPLASLEQACENARKHRAKSTGAITIWLADGVYRPKTSLRLDRRDSGTPDGPLAIRALPAAKPVISGALPLDRLTKIPAGETDTRLPPAARDKVIAIDLPRQAEIPPLVLGGFGSGRGFTTHPFAGLYFNHQPMPLASGPAEGVLISGTGADPANRGIKESKTGELFYQGDRPARWAGDPNAWLHGYWFWDWAESYEKLATVDPANHHLTLEGPWHKYGYRAGQRFRAIHALSELDQPGEWYLDPDKHRIWFWPPADPKSAPLEISLTSFTLLDLKDTAHLIFDGITWEGGGADAIHVTGGKHCLFHACTVRQMGGDGIVINGGHDHGLLACDIHTMGRGGVVLRGGDRKTLEPARHFIENCHIHDLSRLDRTYTPAILCDGVGNHLARNLLDTVPSSAIRLGGNDHLVELNEIHHAVTESDDQGAVDMWGDPTLRGNVFRWNYFHHIGSQWAPDGKPARHGQAGIRLDDAISGTTITGNLFFRAGGGGHGFGAVQIHGGKDNLVAANVFIECLAAVSLSPWQDDRWRQFAAKFLDKPTIDRTIYQQHYPEFSSLLESANANQVRGNLAIRCDNLLLRGPGRTTATANRETKDQPGFSLTEDGRLQVSTDPAAWKAAGIEVIPIDQIGIKRPLLARP